MKITLDSSRLKVLRFLSPVFWLCLACQAADVLSSLPASGKHSPYLEQNPFARHADGHFWLYHAVVTKCYWMLAFGLFSVLLYVALAKINKKVARLVATGPYLYFAILALDAAFQNVLLFSNMGRF